LVRSRFVTQAALALQDMTSRSTTTLGKVNIFPLRLDARSGWFRQLLILTVVAGVYYVSAKIGLSLAIINTNVSAVWPPTGIAIAAVLLFGYRVWPAVLVGALLANGFTPVGWRIAGAIAVGNTLEAVSAGFLLSRIGFHVSFERVKDVAKFVFATFICTMVSATVGNLALVLGGSASWQDFGSLWLTWWLGDSVGAFIVTPLILVWSGVSGRWLPTQRYIEGAVIMLLLGLTATVTYTGSALIPLKYYPFARLTVPFFIYAAFRLGYPGVTMGTLIVSIFAAWGTARGLGPLAGRGSNDTLLLLQVFAGSNALTFLLLVAVLEERRDSEAALRENERRLASNLAVTRILADSPDLKDAAPRILRTIAETLGWKLGALWVPDRTGENLQCLEVWHVPSSGVKEFVNEARNRVFASGTGLPGRVWASRLPAWIQEVERDANFPRSSVAFSVGLRSAFAFPLLFGEKFFGVMEFFSEEIREPDEAMLAMFGGIGSQIGLFIERRQAETVVRELAAIVESADDAVMGKNLNGVITSWNAGAQKLFGYTAEEIVGREILALIPRALHDEERQLLDRLNRGESLTQFETIRIAKDGTEMNVSLTISPVRAADGLVIGASTIARNITEWKKAERERERLLLREQDARAEAEAANRSKDEFLASVSHELRTPLNAIVGWAALLRAGMLEPENHGQAIEVIDRNAKLQARLIEDLLDVSRIVSGNIRFEPRPIRLPEVIEAAVDSVRPSADEKKIELRVELDQATGLVQGDPDRMQQVVWNLLTNAVKFTPESGRIDVQLRTAQTNAEILITDNGEGIRPDFLPHVFDRFRQADSTTTRRHRGIGIGLAIVQHLVQLHSGEVTVASDGEGKGVTVCVTLPTINRNGQQKGSSGADEIESMEAINDVDAVK
jgi:PAS domain S-box-containing protein